MTIQEAFETYKEIEIIYTFIDECCECGEEFRTLDAAFSFAGDIEYFTGDYQKSFGAMQLNDIIRPLKMVNSSGEPMFIFEKDTTHEDYHFCPKCKANK